MADISVKLNSDRLAVIVPDRFVVIVFESGGGRGNAYAARTPGSGYRQAESRYSETEREFMAPLGDAGAAGLRQALRTVLSENGHA